MLVANLNCRETWPSSKCRIQTPVVCNCLTKTKKQLHDIGEFRDLGMFQANPKISKSGRSPMVRKRQLSSGLPILPTFCAQKFDFGQVWNQRKYGCLFHLNPVKGFVGANTLRAGHSFSNPNKKWSDGNQNSLTRNNWNQLLFFFVTWGFLPGNPREPHH